MEIYGLSHGELSKHLAVTFPPTSIPSSLLNVRTFHALSPKGESVTRKYSTADFNTDCSQKV